ncbi:MULTISPECIES: hypothetical protein [unclassified Nocardiopsis]|uniref:hypothetical protein n=1 Tax=Nocardiopsis TaxID=2013 RepID=UPI00387AA4AB
MSARTGLLDSPLRRDAVAVNLIMGPILGALAVFGLFWGVDDAVTRWEYATRAETSPGTVTAVVDGRPEVVFTTADGTEVTTLARGTHLHGDDLDVDVLHLPGEPEEAALSDGMWVPPLLYCAPAVLALIAFGVQHPNGPRAVLYRARQRAHRFHRSNRARRRRAADTALTAPVVVRLAAGGVLATGSAVVLAVTLLRVATGMWEGANPEFLLAAAAALLFLPGLNLLFQGWWRYLEHVSREKPPAPPRLLPEGVIIGGWVLSVPVVIVVVAAAFVVGIRGEHIEDPVHGTGTVLSTGCGDINTGRGCGGRVVVEYDADGLRYVAVVGDLGRDLNAGARLPLVWDAGDPMRVRSGEEGIDN